ncbi:MAG: nucleotidyltransferase family protein [Candidatus Omnitrophica bacterium]|nr:nucleotidyltransferase family protein [Candidatus Omnitrophota bacterium]MBU4478129.1 nucleotidyltransferase family protein [Candidatus Omnitrophota bacterium]MCG2704074.1 nucleotidyltransferase family protein [Candidatus Omnitrophota bacterium]
MKALILAAGYATRLYPLTKHWPKPLLLVKEKPIISHIAEKIDNLNGIDEIIVITNNKFFHYFEEWAGHFTFKTKISVLNDKTTSEKDRLGAIGDINFVLNNHAVDDDLLIVGGDNLFSFDLKKFVAFAKNKNNDCTVGVYNIKDPSLVKHYGVVTLDDENRIIRFQEKPEYSDSTLISMCIYYFPRKSLESVREYVRKKDCHDTSGDYISWLHKEKNVFGYEFEGVWYDIGDIITFYHASVTFKE